MCNIVYSDLFIFIIHLYLVMFFFNLYDDIVTFDFFSVSVKLSEYLLADHFPFGYPLIPPYAYPNGSSVSILT